MHYVVAEHNENMERQCGVALCSKRIEWQGKMIGTLTALPICIPSSSSNPVSSILYRHSQIVTECQKSQPLLPIPTKNGTLF